MQVLPRLFKLLPWVDLDTFYAKVKFGFCMGKSENYLFFFGNCCSLRSQSCLKHSTKWGNEVEWVSMVKVILLLWSKFTQISKLNVRLLACILRWAIQGLLALLFRTDYRSLITIITRDRYYFQFCIETKYRSTVWEELNRFVLNKILSFRRKPCRI